MELTAKYCRFSIEIVRRLGKPWEIDEKQFLIRIRRRWSGAKMMAALAEAMEAAARIDGERMARLAGRPMFLGGAQSVAIAGEPWLIQSTCILPDGSRDQFTLGTPGPAVRVDRERRTIWISARHNASAAAGEIVQAVSELCEQAVQHLLDETERAAATTAIEGVLKAARESIDVASNTLHQGKSFNLEGRRLATA
ncbi:MAG TPA: hypothetical protein PKB10_04290 [Tepidisphaeraceae bacterium]|nr:hypothetical protein [Tepidisphaeraceae bacterium]